jgi:zinc protease
MRRWFAGLAVFAAFTGACTAARVQSVTDPGLGSVSDPAVRYGKLANGLTYFIRANAEPLDRAELRLVVNAGSVLEDPDQLGLAHFVEHMAFNGTRSFERQAIVDYLESVGMRFGPDVNAYTSFDETVYTLTVPTDNAGVLDTGIQILQEWASGVSFDSLQVEQERGVVIEEWRLIQGAATRLQNLQFPTLAMNSRYAERLPIGTHESLATFDHAALKRFYRDWYRPDLMGVIAVGHFDPDSVEAIIRRRFESLTMPDTVRNREEYPL